MLGRNETIMSQATNVQADDTENIFKDMEIDFESIQNSDSEPKILTSTMLQQLTEAGSHQQEPINPDFKNNLSELEHDGVHNNAGYIAYRLRSKEALGAPTSQQMDSSYTWSNEVSERGRFKPNDEFIDQIYRMEEIFNEYKGAELKCGPNYIKNLLQN